MFYLTTHSTHFIYGYMASDIWLRTILIVRKETRCRHIGYSFWLTARVLLYVPSHRQDSTYHGLCYTSCGVLAGTRNNSMGPPHEGSNRRPIAPWANALTMELHLAPRFYNATVEQVTLNTKDMLLYVISVLLFFPLKNLSFFFLTLSTSGYCICFLGDQLKGIVFHEFSNEFSLIAQTRSNVGLRTKSNNALKDYQSQRNKTKVIDNDIGVYRRKEENVLFHDALNTFYLQLFLASDIW